jgi:hypothetical protein
MEICDIKRKYDKLKKIKEQKKERIHIEDTKSKTFHDIGKDTQFEELCNKWNNTSADNSLEFDEVLKNFDQ